MFAPGRPRLGAVAAVLVASACASRAPRVPVVAAGGDVTSLVGQWAGDYSSPTTGRSGSIQFTLHAGTDSAFGDVLMVPRGMSQPIRRVEDPAAPGAAARREPSLLSISFVRVEGGSVSGRLDPYVDPDCSCTVETTFRGAASGDVIEGTFETRGPGGRQTGRWRVRRVGT
jgi:hypothetical protein